MRISDWSSDVCSSDLADYPLRFGIAGLDLTGLSQKCRKEQRVIGAPRPPSAAVDRPLMGCAGDSQSHEPSDLVSLARVDVERPPRTSLQGLRRGVRYDSHQIGSASRRDSLCADVFVLVDAVPL